MWHTNVKIPFLTENKKKKWKKNSLNLNDIASAPLKGKTGTLCMYIWYGLVSLSYISAYNSFEFLSKYNLASWNNNLSKSPPPTHTFMARAY